MSGPFESEREARLAAQDIAVDPPNAVSPESNRRLLEEACAAAGVQLGAWDHRILLWLAGFEPSTCAVIAGLISRAAVGRLSPEELATVLDALDVAADYKRDRVATCPDCDASPADLCGTCEYRLTRAEEYDALAEAL